MTRSVTIRPVQPEDYAALARIGSAAFPGVPHSAEEMRDVDRLPEPLKGARLVAEVDGRPAGTASYFQSLSRYHPQKFWLDLFVHPHFQGQGIGSALYDRVMAEIAPYDPILVRTFTREDLVHSLRFFERRGYVEAKRAWESHLDLAAFDFTPYLGAEAKARAHGIAIRQMSELLQPGWEQRYLDLYNAIQRDVPDIDPATEVTMEQFRKGRLESPRFMAEGHFIALDGDRWIGLNSLWKGTEPHELRTGLTGVLPEYRGKGIALALKIRGLAWAREQGCKKVTTGNASTNRPMLAINEKLGFVRQPAWIHLLRVTRTHSPAFERPKVRSLR